MDLPGIFNGDTKLCWNYLYQGTKAVFNIDVVGAQLTLNGDNLTDGVYDESTHPTMFAGTGSIEVNSSLSTENIVFIDNGFLKVVGSLEYVVLYNILGQRVYESGTVKKVNLRSLKSGIYIVRYKVDGKLGSEKIYYSK
jgi:hypothetical protein